MRSEVDTLTLAEWIPHASRPTRGTTLVSVGPGLWAPALPIAEISAYLHQLTDDGEIPVLAHASAGSERRCPEPARVSDLVLEVFPIPPGLDQDRFAKWLGVELGAKRIDFVAQTRLPGGSDGAGMRLSAAQARTLAHARPPSAELASKLEAGSDAVTLGVSRVRIGTLRDLRTGRAAEIAKAPLASPGVRHTC